MSDTSPNFDVALHKELLSRVGRGETAAFKEVYELFAGPLYSLAFRILGTREEAEEVIQDVFVVIWNRAADYKPDLSRPFSWMILITRRLCWNKLRSKGRQARKIRALEDEVQADVNPSHEPPPFEQTEDSEVKTKIKSEIDEFPELQRKCLELALYDGFTHDEISGILDIPLGTVKTWIRRGIIKLKDQLGAEV